MTLLVAVTAFVAGVGLVILATGQLLEGLVGIARAARMAPFAASVVLSGMEAENIAVGIAAGSRGESDVALGTAFGGATFLLCVALGLGAVVAPLSVRLPRGVVALVPAAAVLAGLPVLFGVTPRWSGVVLLLAFGAAIAYLIAISRHHQFVDDAELREAGERPHSLVTTLVLTTLSIGLVAAGGELVAYGASGLITSAGLAAGLIGMVITPAAIEAEEIIRQVVPARRGYADISAGNAVGTVLYFVLFNLGLVALFTPVAVPAPVRVLDWPFLVGSAVVAAVFLFRGRVNRVEGACLAGMGMLYLTLHIIIR